jgi:phosphatidate phosphatase APP1
MIRRFFSSEVPHARVRASHGGYEIEVTADEEGFFDVVFELAEPLRDETDWHPVQIEVAWPRSKGGVRATGRVLVPAGARFGVVSDLDDTVVHSSATDLLRMARITLLSNAHTRLPFEGVTAFYQALQRGLSGDEFNPIFYVSNGPWNLYDMIEDLLDVHGIPAGPLFLRDWSPTKLRERGEHKLGVIRTLLQTYPDLPFVLIGDSGERDPEIYHQIVHEHPERILAIYIRDVTPADRDAEVHKISKELQDLGVEMLLTPATAEAAGHAEGLGLVPPGTSRSVELEAGR